MKTLKIVKSHLSFQIYSNYKNDLSPPLKDDQLPFQKYLPSHVVNFTLLFSLLLFTLISCSNLDDIDVDLNKKPIKSTPQLLTSGLQGASGSAIGPGGDLFVTEGLTGTISRIDKYTGDKTIFASGLPSSIIGAGGVNDLTFIGGKAYALVTLLGPQFGNNDIVGIYKITGPNSYEVIADIGTFSVNNPPANTDFFVQMGVQYAIQTYRGGFLVTDGHHNRILHITLDGEITEFMTFGNVVPTGLAVKGNQVLMAEAGPIPHNPEDGKIVSFSENSSNSTTLATGAPLMVDVELGPKQNVYALAQGEWNGAGNGSPAFENDGSLLKLNSDGTLSVITHGLNQPTSVEFIKNTAYIISLSGEVWTVEIDR